MADVSYTIVERLGTLSTSGNYTIDVNMISWNGREPKLDIRHFYWAKDGLRMRTGISLSDNEARALLELLKRKFAS